MAANQAPSSSSSRKTKTPNNDAPLTEPSHDIIAAAQKLMQLSDQDDKNKDNEGVDQMQRDMKINENIEIIDRPKKVKKYRSLVDIYKVTRPINVRRR